MTVRNIKLRFLDAFSIAALVAALVFAGWRWSESRRASAPPEWEMALNVDGIENGAIRIGPKSARLTLVEFSDFQCPFCKLASFAIDSLVQKYPGQVHYVFRHLPLHAQSFMAATAARCADQQGHFLAMHDSLFQHSSELREKPMSTIAAEIFGIDGERFSRCMVDPAVHAGIAIDTVAAIKYKLTGTPTFFVGDRMYTGNPGFASLDSIARSRGLRPSSF